MTYLSIFDHKCIKKYRYGQL